MTTTSEAHILVTIPNATLTSSTSGTLTGQLALEYVTFDIPPTAAAVTQDVLLVLVLRTGNKQQRRPIRSAARSSARAHRLFRAVLPWCTAAALPLARHAGRRRVHRRAPQPKRERKCRTLSQRTRRIRRRPSRSRWAAAVCSCISHTGGGRRDGGGA